MRTFLVNKSEILSRLSSHEHVENVRLCGIVKMWLACNDTSKTVEVLRSLESITCGDTQEVLHDLAGMIEKFPQIV